VGPWYHDHARRPRRDIVTRSCRERDDTHGEVAETDSKGRELRRNFLEAVLVESHEVHFVDGQHQMTNTEQRGDKRMPLGLRKHTLARIG
jgi:hypothetical protein